MQIDWITVIAQILNFLILVWLLRRFLYQPVIDAMDRREQRIRDRLEEARARERRAEAEAARHRAELQDLRSRRDELMDAARRAAENHRQELEEEAREAVERRRQRWEEEIQRERETFLRGLGRQVAEGLVAVARRVLGDLAGTELEAQVVRRFTERLRELTDEQRGELAGTAGALEVRSAFELDDDARDGIRRSLHEALGTGVEVRFARHPELVCGIELVGEGRKLAWTIAEYLEDLEDRIDRSLEAPRADARQAAS